MSAILHRVINNFDDPVLIGSSNCHRFFFSARYGGWHLKGKGGKEKKKEEERVNGKGKKGLRWDLNPGPTESSGCSGWLWSV